LYRRIEECLEEHSQAPLRETPVQTAEAIYLDLQSVHPIVEERTTNPKRKYMSNRSNRGPGGENSQNRTLPSPRFF
jgi:hypothetical protein